MSGEGCGRGEVGGGDRIIHQLYVGSMLLFCILLTSVAKLKYHASLIYNITGILMHSKITFELLF